MSEAWDVFFSYRTHGSLAAQPLVGALERGAGVRHARLQREQSLPMGTDQRLDGRGALRQPLRPGLRLGTEIRRHRSLHLGELMDSKWFLDEDGDPAHSQSLVAASLARG